MKKEIKKTCTKCGKKKELTEFDNRKKNTHEKTIKNVSAYCKNCGAKIVKKYRQKKKQEKIDLIKELSLKRIQSKSVTKRQTTYAAGDTIYEKINLKDLQYTPKDIKIEDVAELAEIEIEQLINLADMSNLFENYKVLKIIKTLTKTFLHEFALLSPARQQIVSELMLDENITTKELAKKIEVNINSTYLSLKEIAKIPAFSLLRIKNNKF